ncbi:uncharacterized [Tachysurus ichikawai]
MTTNEHKYPKNNGWIFSRVEQAKGAVAEILCAKLFITLIIILIIICQLWSGESPNFISHHRNTQQPRLTNQPEISHAETEDW